MSEQELIDVYLDWVNNYISLDAFSGAHRIDRALAVQRIRLGKKYYQKRLEAL